MTTIKYNTRQRLILEMPVGASHTDFRRCYLLEHCEKARKALSQSIYRLLRKCKMCGDKFTIQYCTAKDRVTDGFIVFAIITKTEIGANNPFKNNAKFGDDDDLEL